MIKLNATEDKMKKKLFVILPLLLICSLSCFSQELYGVPDTIDPNNKAVSLFPVQLDLGLGAHMQYNAAPLPSAPSPILFSAGIGVKVDFFKNFSFAPHLNFTATYYLMQDGRGYPASPENRLAYVPSAMIDLPMCYVCSVKQHQFYIGVGIAIFARAAFPASKVGDSEKDKIKAMNKYFWSEAHWLYPSFQMGFDFNVQDGTMCGIFAKVYFPISGSEYSVAQDGVLNVGARILLNVAKPKEN